MKVLVTGASGQVGTQLTLKGQALGFDILAVTSSDLDITQAEKVMQYVLDNKPDIIINAAAYTAVDKAEEESDRAYAVNRDGPANLAATCVVLGMPLLQISTDYIFDGNSVIAYTEQDKPNPVSIYGSSKWAGEQAVTKILPEHIILRVAWVFSATGNNFVRTILRLGAERDQLSVIDDQHGAPTSAADIACALLTIAQRYQDKKKITWGTYHYISKEITTWHGFTKEIFEQAQSQGMLNSPPKLLAITANKYPVKAKRPQNSVLNCQKIQRELGIEQPDWQLALIHVLNEWKNSATYN